MDGHAQYQKVYIEGSEDSEGFAEHYRLELLDSYPPFCDGTDGSLESYSCVIVRGDGWQKDALPAAPIESGLLWPGGGELRPSYENCVEP